MQSWISSDANSRSSIPTSMTTFAKLTGLTSVDAIELLLEIERLLNFELTHDEKKLAMDIRNMRQIIDYVELMANKTRPCMKCDRDLQRDSPGADGGTSAHDGKKSRHHRRCGDHPHRA